MGCAGNDLARFLEKNLTDYALVPPESVFPVRPGNDLFRPPPPPRSTPFLKRESIGVLPNSVWWKVESDPDSLELKLSDSIEFSGKESFIPP